MHIKLAAADKNGQVNIKIGAVRQALLIYTRHQYIILGGYHHDPVMRKITLECWTIIFTTTTTTAAHYVAAI